MIKVVERKGVLDTATVLDTAMVMEMPSLSRFDWEIEKIEEMDSRRIN